MAILIPAYGTCVSRMTGGERRLAQRLEDKLENDYLLWYDVPIGEHNAHPDFVILHPRRGILILEVKDWKPDSIREITRNDVALLTERGLKRVVNPLEQARQYAHRVVTALERDPQLVFSSGKLTGRLRFPWSYGVVLPNISRRQFEDFGFDQAIEPSRVLCQDEMFETCDAESFQQRLWEMFSVRFHGMLTLPQIDRVRWLLYPEIRIPAQGGLFGEGPTEADTPDLLRVMDLQQEQLARSLGDGHRVIHGVAGSGKTMILTYRAQYLAQACTKPILVLCYNRSLAERLARNPALQAEGKIEVRSFHAWCIRQARAYHVTLPPDVGPRASEAEREAWYAEAINRTIAAVDNGQIPSSQYEAVLIDEGHDFRPEWLKLIVRMVDAKTNSLLLLYDDAQSIYQRNGKRKFSFKSVGVQAQGRSTILKINYRNTQEVLDLATRVAADLLAPESADDDGVPLLAPVGAGRHGPPPLVVNLPTLEDEARFIAERFMASHQLGTAWSDMALIYRDYHPVGGTLIRLLRRSGVPIRYFRDAKASPDADEVLAITMHSCKGLEFPLVAVAGIGRGEHQDEAEEKRLLYVAMTRATRDLVMSGT